MNLERDKYLTEAMGECWHEHTFGTCPSVCCKCKIKNKVTNEYGEIYQGTNFSTWEGFGRLWEWAQKQDWWGDFRPTEMLKLHLCKDFAWCNPDTFANAVYNYLKERDN